jgi:hypothetical protein
MTTTATVPGCPVDESFNPLSPEFLADPYAVLARRPGRGSPVFFAPSIGYYVVTSYDAIDAVFRDQGTYSAAVAQAPLAPIVPDAQQILLAGGHKPQPSMVSLLPDGVPEQDYNQVKQWCGYRAALSFGRPAAEDQVEIATTMAAYRRYMRDLAPRS